MRKRRPASQSSTTKKPRPTSGLNNLRPNLKTHQGRLAPRLLIKTKAHDICIQESRANSWLWFWLIMAGCLLSAGIVYVVSLPDRDAFDFAAFTFILLVIFIAPIFLLLYLPWNRRLKFNPNRSTYQLQKRFYGIVYKKTRVGRFALLFKRGTGPASNPGNRGSIFTYVWAGRAGSTTNIIITRPTRPFN